MSWPLDAVIIVGVFTSICSYALSIAFFLGLFDFLRECIVEFVINCFWSLPFLAVGGGGGGGRRFGKGGGGGGGGCATDKRSLVCCFCCCDIHAGKFRRRPRPADCARAAADGGAATAAG